MRVRAGANGNEHEQAGAKCMEKIDMKKFITTKECNIQAPRYLRTVNFELHLGHKLLRILWLYNCQCAPKRSSSNGPLPAERPLSMFIVCLQYARSMRQLIERAQRTHLGGAEPSLVHSRKSKEFLRNPRNPNQVQRIRRTSGEIQGILQDIQRFPKIP